MTREYEIPSKIAKRATENYLKSFRACVEDPRLPLDEHRLDLWIEALGEDYEDLAEDIYMRWRKLRYRYLAMPESTLSLLKTLHKQYQLAIVTNGPSQSQWEKIRELKIEEHFDCIVVSGDLKWEKPQPEIFHRVCTALGVQPFECLMVGDKVETDIVGGFQAQLGITVWIPLAEPGQELPNPPPDYVIRDIHQLTGILQGGNEKAKSKAMKLAKKTSSNSVATAGTSAAATAEAAGQTAVKPGPSTSAAAVPASGSTSSDTEH